MAKPTRMTTPRHRGRHDAFAMLAALVLAGGTAVFGPAKANDKLPGDPASPEAGEAPAPPTTLDETLRVAFENNPQLHAAFARWQAARERIPQARALEDPALSFETFVEQVDTRYRVSVTQRFPAFGARRQRERRAAAEARAAQHLFEAERIDLYERVVRAFHEYRYLARASEVTEANLRLLTQLEQAIDARYRDGNAPFADLIRVRIEHDRLADRMAALHDQRRPRSADLAALLNLPADDPLPWPAGGAATAMPLDENELAGRLTELNPELKAMAARIEAAVYGEDLARRDGWPRPMLGAGWMAMRGMDGRADETDIGLMAGISLPIWRSRIRAGRREAEALTQAAIHEQDARTRRARANLSMAVFQFRDAERRLRLFQESLIPSAEQALEVIRHAYAEGGAGFTDLIDAQRTLLEFQLLTERAAADREIAIGDIGFGVVTSNVPTSDTADRSDPPDPSDRPAPQDRPEAPR